MRVVTISHTWRHHAERSGYSNLARYLAGSEDGGIGLANRWSARLIRALPGRIREGLARRSRVSHYISRYMAQDVSVIEDWLASRNTIYHFLYGENTYRFAGNVKRWPSMGKHNRLVATFHLPPSRLVQVMHTTRAPPAAR